MICISVLAWMCFGSSKIRAQDTYFIDYDSTLSTLGQSWAQQFTVPSRQVLVLRFVADLKADAAIFVPAQLDNFQNNRRFFGYGLFNNSFGTKYVTLNPGTYYVGVRNQVQGSNRARIELDTRIQLDPEPGEEFTYYDRAFHGNKYVGKNGGKLWHGFRIVPGFRYFLDGANSGGGQMPTYIIPKSELDNFRYDRGFEYYTDYFEQGGAGPGHVELELPPGDYYFVCENNAGINKALTYTMERWKVRTIPNGQEIDLSGSASWSTSGSQVNIEIDTVSNEREGGTSGSLRLRLWATKAPYAGRTISGYVLGTRALGQLSGGYYYSDISGYVPFRRPPSGYYCTTLTVEEYTGSGWVIRDFINFSGTTRF